MDLKEGEYALSKDTTVALWKDYTDVILCMVMFNCKKFWEVILW